MSDSHDRIAGPPGLSRNLRDPVLAVLCAILVLSYVVGAVDIDHWVGGLPRWPVEVQLSMLPIHYWALGAILWRLGLSVWLIVPLVVAAVCIEAAYLHWSAIVTAWLFFALSRH